MKERSLRLSIPYSPMAKSQGIKARGKNREDKFLCIKNSQFIEFLCVKGTDVFLLLMLGHRSTPAQTIPRTIPLYVQKQMIILPS